MEAFNWQIYGCVNVFVLITFVILLFGLFIPKECSNSSINGDCDLRPCNRLLKRDFKYCVLILILCIVFISTLIMGKASEIFSYISFASTITSIILSVLAIFMTMLAESKSDATKTKMENFLTQIEKISDSTKSQVARMETVSKDMEDKYDLYKKFIEKQDLIISQQEILLERTKSIEEGLREKGYKNQENLWRESKISSEEDEK